MGDTNLLDIGGGPKTPGGIRRLYFLALFAVILIIYGYVFDIWLLAWIGEFVLNNLLFFGTLLGIIIVLITYRGLIKSHRR